MNMNIDEKIIRFLEDKLSKDEKVEFENLLSESNELRKDVEKYKKLLNLIDETKDPDLDPNYKVESLDKFRDSSAINKKRKFKPGFIYATSTIVVVFAIIITLNFLNSDKTIKTEDISEIELMETLIDYGYSNINELNPALIDSLYQSEISLETKSDTEYLISFNINDYEKTSEVLSEEEVNAIYTSLIDKKFF